MTRPTRARTAPRFADEALLLLLLLVSSALLPASTTIAGAPSEPRPWAAAGELLPGTRVPGSDRLFWRLPVTNRSGRTLFPRVASQSCGCIKARIGSTAWPASERRDVVIETDASHVIGSDPRPRYQVQLAAREATEESPYLDPLILDLPLVSKKK